MCGRGRQTAASVQAVAQALHIPVVFQAPQPQQPQQQQPPPQEDDEEDEYSPFNNGAPGRTAPIVVEGPASEPAVMRLARWGLIPAYQSATTPPDFWRMFNAREDNLVNVHSRLLNSKRCVVPLEGFFEWENRVELGKKRKVPYFVSSSTRSQLPMAGLWDTWKSDQGKVIDSFTIITVSPSEDLKWLHDRMPAILRDEEEIRLWLNEEIPFSQVKHLVRPYTVGALQWWPVTEKIGKLGYQEADCATRVELVKGTKPITNFFTSKKKVQDSKSVEESATLKSANIENPIVPKEEEVVVRTNQPTKINISSAGRVAKEMIEKDDDVVVVVEEEEEESGNKQPPSKKVKVISDFFRKG